MKFAVVLLALFGLTLASKSVNTGRSQVMRKDDGHGNYEFGYDEEHHSGGTSRREKGGKGWQTGSYELRDKDGRKRTVKYVADAHGFRAKVETNEPGTDGKEDPADVELHANPMQTYYSEPSYKSYDSYSRSDNSYDSHSRNDDYNNYHSRPSGYSASWHGPSSEQYNSHDSYSKY